MTFGPLAARFVLESIMILEMLGERIRRKTLSFPSVFETFAWLWKIQKYYQWRWHVYRIWTTGFTNMYRMKLQ